MRGLRSVSAILLIAALSGVSCTLDPAALAVADTFFQGPNSRVDAVFVVDDSNSMEALQSSLAAAVPGFIAELDAAGVEYRIGVATTDMNDPDRRGRLVNGAIAAWDQPTAAATLAAAVQPGIMGSQLERGLASAWAAVTPPLSTHENEGLRRPDARLAVVIVSDEDDCSDDGELPSSDPSACAQFQGDLVPVGEYAARFRSMVEDDVDVSVHALVETGVSGPLEGCGGLNVGTRYVRLARLLGGMVAPHCDDMTASMSELALQVAGRRSAFPLTRTPDPLTISVVVAESVQPVGDDDDSAPPPGENEVSPDEALVGASVSEDLTRENGWTYDAESNTVRIWGEALPGLGDAVQI
ncbi:MAG: hypothetical protein KDA24_15090, partial [Deltaproteobacteria bacterium]|nr:hypothetical protein [Deltaproteobacteria bacterium]